MNEIRINNLALPRTLVELIAAGRWAATDDERIEQVFGEKPSQANFYSLEDMTFENDAWLTETLPEYLGNRDDVCPPGDIDPQASVLIGDLGHDLPFALDYRRNPTSPSVVFLGTRAEGRWVTVANNINELVSRLGMTLDDVPSSP